MALPDYVAGIDEDTFQSMLKDGEYCRNGNKQIETPEHVASVFMVAAVTSDPKTSAWLTYNDGKSIEPLASLVQYGDADLVRDGMEYALTKLYNYEAHGSDALSVLADAAHYDGRSTRQWSEKTVNAFLDELAKIPHDDIKNETEKSLAEQSTPVRAMSYIMDVMRSHIDENGKGAEEIKERMIAYSVAFLKSAAKSQDKIPYLTEPAYILEQYADESDLELFRDIIEQAYDMEKVTSSPHFEHNKKWNPRIIGHLSP